MATSSADDYENVGLYEWVEGQNAWVLLGSDYNPFFETEEKRSYDEFVPDSTLYGSDPGGPGGGGGGGYIEPYRGKKADKIGVQCTVDEPKTMPTVTATGKRPSDFGGSLLTLIWRGQLLNGAYGGGGAQSSAVTRAVPPPPGFSGDVTCSDEVSHRSKNAEHVAAHYKFTPFPRQRNRQITIRWPSGTVETYSNTGSPATPWMIPVAGTCRSGN